MKDLWTAMVLCGFFVSLGVFAYSIGAFLYALFGHFTMTIALGIMLLSCYLLVLKFSPKKDDGANNDQSDLK